MQDEKAPSFATGFPTPHTDRQDEKTSAEPNYKDVNAA